MGHLHEESIVDRAESRREKFVPLHTTDLVQFLADHPALKKPHQAAFRQLASLILSMLHQLYRQKHERLTYIYAPLDPDRDTLLMSVPVESHRNRLCDELFQRLEDVLIRANYQRLTPEAIDRALRAASQWGVRMRVNFDLFQRLDVYVRGDVIGRRRQRSWRKYYRFETLSVPIYQRLVIVFRTQAASDYEKRFDCNRVYLRMFKNIPQQDVDMMLPSSGIRMSLWDHSRIVLPSIYAACVTAWRVLRNVLLLTLVGLFKTLAIIFLIVFAILYGLKSMFTYSLNTRRRYMLNMTQNLYYQNLDNNAGVLQRILEEGEQQEACEAILAYFAAAVLHGDQSELTLEEIDRTCESIVHEATGIHVDFDIEDAANDLLQLGIFSMRGSNWSAMPLEAAVEQLDRTWDSWFIANSGWSPASDNARD